jgi:hypothetical protein
MEENLTAFGEMAKRHWKKFRPKMVKHLEKQGVLHAALINAQEIAKAELADRMRAGESYPQAKDEVLRMWILLPDEKEVKRLSPDQMPYSQP